MTVVDPNIAIVTSDLERVAETHGDITAAVYERFFDVSPESEALLGHTDQAMQGRMLQQTLELLLSDEHLGPDGYLDWELDNHLIGYRVTRAMYLHYLKAICEVVVPGAKPHAAEAWHARTRKIVDRIDAFEARRAGAGAAEA
ncbi:MAG: hypothetical protein AAGG11_08995 [Pseudomonadota bacterium]